MKLSPRALGLTSGIMWGAAIMLATWWVLILDTGGNTLFRLKNFYLGYDVTWLGSIIGLVWGFIDGLICGLIFAWIYNAFAKGEAAPASAPMPVPAPSPEPPPAA